MSSTPKISGFPKTDRGCTSSAFAVARGGAFAWPCSSPAASLNLDDFLEVPAGSLTMQELVEHRRLPTAASKRRKVLAAMEEVVHKNRNPLNTPAVCSPGNRRSSVMLGRSPCLTRQRAAEGGHWLVHRGRMMTTREVFMLQGLKPERWRLPEGVTQSHLRGCAGNAMSGNVIKAVLTSVLAALGEV